MWKVKIRIAETKYPECMSSKPFPDLTVRQCYVIDGSAQQYYVLGDYLLEDLD